MPELDCCLSPCRLDMAERIRISSRGVPRTLDAAKSQAASLDVRLSANPLQFQASREPEPVLPYSGTATSLPHPPFTGVLSRCHNTYRHPDGKPYAESGVPCNPAP